MISQNEADPRVQEWFHHLVLRTYTDTYSRNHFPIIIETENSEFWSHKVFMKLDIEYHHYPAFDLYSPSQTQIRSTYMGNSDTANNWAIIRYAFMAGLEHRRQTNLKGKHTTSIDEFSKDMIEKERVMFNSKLCKVLADDQLATLKDTEAHVFYGKLLNLLYNFGKEENKLGLFTYYYHTNHYYDDTFVSVYSI